MDSKLKDQIYYESTVLCWRMTIFYMRDCGTTVAVIVW